MQIFKKATIFILLIAINNILSAQKIKFRGLDFDDLGYEKVLKKAKLTRGLESFAEASSLKMYAPYSKSQGEHGTRVEILYVVKSKDL